jgi:hypothetical protein
LIQEKRYHLGSISAGDPLDYLLANMDQFIVCIECLPKEASIRIHFGGRLGRKVMPASRQIDPGALEYFHPSQNEPLLRREE